MTTHVLSHRSLSLISKPLRLTRTFGPSLTTSTSISSNNTSTGINNGKLFFSTTLGVQSGHNKWSTIKHDKAKNDAQKNKVALKFAGQIAVAARLGGTDPGMNFRLATAIDNANKANVPKKIIESAIKRGSGEGSGSGSGAQSEMAVYEGMGPGGVAFVVEALTDNKNRTVGQVKAAFSKVSGVLSPSAYLFTKRGWVEVIPKVEGQTLDDAFEDLIDLGAEDLEQIENESSPGAAANESKYLFVVYTSVQDTAKVAQSLKDEGYGIKDLGIEYAPNEDTMVTSLDNVQQTAFDKLCNSLDDIDDVVEIYTNLKL